MPTGSRNGAQSVEDASEDEENQLCPICLNPLRPLERAVPDTCNHGYCLSCILRWAQLLQICPVDRRPFSSICTQDPVLGYIEIPVKSSTNCVCNSKDEEKLESCSLEGKNKKRGKGEKRACAERTCQICDVTSPALKKVKGETCRSQLLTQHSEPGPPAQQGETLGLLTQVT